ncbi:polysaccharide biosynthesis C-terminal domain-containing protein [Enterococcus faecium]|uniref:oligosaccharide flippase family protein n=1 Tax=Enterococcus faecium TaxID=1352 RepID=UPI0032EDD9C8
MITSSFSALSFFVAKIAVTLYQNATKTVLGLLSTMAAVGYYSNSYSLIMICGNVINAMNTIMIPRMSSLYGNKNEKKMISLLQKTIHFQLFFTIAIMFGLILLSDKLVDWYFGTNFSSMKSIIPCLAPVVVTQSFQMSVATQYLIPKIEMKEYNISILIGAVITVICTVVFVPFIGVYGAVVGINLGYLIVSLLRLRVLLKETTFKFEYKNVIKWIFSGLLMFWIGYMLTKNMASSITTTLFQVTIGIVLYLGITSLLNVNPLVGIFKKEVIGKIRK